MPDRLVIATRGSRLALKQAEIVSAALALVEPDIEIVLSKVTTRGDKSPGSFSSIGGKGLFVAEVEREVVEGRADIAVHSAKDLTSDLHPEAHLVCIPNRASVHDVVIGSSGDSGIERLQALAMGARVGTSSMRRRSLLSEARPDLEIVEFRGNIDTRVRKVQEGEVDAAILAAAGLERLGGLDISAGALDPEWWVPAPAQGALAVEARSDRPDLASLLARIDVAASHAEVVAERSFTARLEGGCSIPLGCLARASGERLVVAGFLGHPEGGESRRDRISGPIEQAEALGIELAGAILDAGGSDLLEELHAMGAPEVPAP